MRFRSHNRSPLASAASNAALSVRDRVLPVAAFIGLIWLVYLVSYLLPINQFGLVPRSFWGLTGIVSMPFLHGNIGHIVSNTVALAVLMTLLVVSRPRAFAITCVLTLVSGISLWVLGRTAVHIGASGLIYALMGFLLVAGLTERRPLSLIIAVIVGFSYGSVILSGIIPGSKGVSWEGHLVGLVAGALIAWLQFRQR